MAMMEPNQDGPAWVQDALNEAWGGAGMNEHEQLRAAAVEIIRLQKEVVRWKDRCERAEEALRLTIDEGIPAW